MNHFFCFFSVSGSWARINGGESHEKGESVFVEGELVDARVGSNEHLDVNTLLTSLGFESAERLDFGDLVGGKALGEDVVVGDDVGGGAFGSFIGGEEVADHVHCVGDGHEVSVAGQVDVIFGCQVTGNAHLVLPRARTEALGFAVAHGLHGRRIVDVAELLGKFGAVLERVELLVFVGQEADDTMVGGCVSPAGGVVEAVEEERARGGEG